MSTPLPTVLTRGVESILPNAEGLAQRMAERPIRLYLGIDPTGNQLHLGHAVVLQKLQEFVELGHQVILLIGNGTVRIGDPTGKDATRPVLSDAEIAANFATWKEQAKFLLDFDSIEVRHNGDWLDKLTFADMVRLMSQMTVQQLLERDMFQERLKRGAPIHVHELAYPLAQGYDSVAMDVDLEIGGSDQLFNMMVGRHLMQTMKNREKFVLGTPLLVGNDGRKMGKSLNNFISLVSSADDMYGKLMSVVDEAVEQYWTLLTRKPLEEIAAEKQAVAAGELHPMEWKKQMARTITRRFHDELAVQAAEAHFVQTVQEGEMPSEVPELALSPESVRLFALVQQVSEKLGDAWSGAECKRRILQGGVLLNQEVQRDPYLEVTPRSGDVLKLGKRLYVRLVVAA